MANNIANTYWNLLQELSQDSNNSAVLGLLNSNSEISDELVRQILSNTRISDLFLLDPVLATNPELQKQFIRNFPYTKTRLLNQEIDQTKVPAASYSEGQFPNTSELSSEPTFESPDFENPEFNNTPTQNFPSNTADSEINQNIQTQDELSLKTKTNFTPGQVQVKENPSIKNENQEISNDFSLNNPVANPENSKDSISQNKQNLSQKQQSRAQKLLKRGVPIQQGPNSFATQKKQAPKMSLLKKGVLAGAFSTVTAGSGLTLFQLLFT